MSTHTSFSAARDEFERAWNDPAHTRIEPTSVDVNALLSERFRGGEEITLTRSMLWEAELEKAWNPGDYIPGVVREGESWRREALGPAEDSFVRASQQRAWKEGVDGGLVLEEVYTSTNEQSVLFLGRAELTRADGTRLEAGRHQPLFHVEHAVSGTDTQPLKPLAHRAPDVRAGRGAHRAAAPGRRHARVGAGFRYGLCAQGPRGRADPALTGPDRRARPARPVLPVTSAL